MDVCWGLRKCISHVNPSPSKLWSGVLIQGRGLFKTFYNFFLVWNYYYWNGTLILCQICFIELRYMMCSVSGVPLLPSWGAAGHIPLRLRHSLQRAGRHLRLQEQRPLRPRPGPRISPSSSGTVCPGSGSVRPSSGPVRPGSLRPSSGSVCTSEGAEAILAQLSYDQLWPLWL